MVRSAIVSSAIVSNAIVGSETRARCLWHQKGLASYRSPPSMALITCYATHHLVWHSSMQSTNTHCSADEKRAVMRAAGLPCGVATFDLPSDSPEIPGDSLRVVLPKVGLII